jgi:hypothetical protein
MEIIGSMLDVLFITAPKKYELHALDDIWEIIIEVRKYIFLLWYKQKQTKTCSSTLNKKQK